MKKIVIICFSLIILNIDAWADYPFPNFTIYSAWRSNVKSVIIKTYNIDNSKHELIMYQILNVDDISRYRKLSIYNPDGLLQGSAVLEYNNNWKFTAYREYDKLNKLLWQTTYQYNDKNQRTIMEDCKEGNQNCTAFLNYYDNANRIIKDEVIDNNKKLKYYNIIEYIDNKVKTTHYSRNGDLKDYYIETYDDDKNRIEFIFFESNGKLSTKLISKYKNKLIIEELDNDFNTGESIKYTYTYLEDGKTKIKLKYKNGILIEKETTVFDGKRKASILLENFKDGEFVRSKLEIYNNKDHVVLEKNISDNQKTETTYEYEYKDGD